MKVLEFLEKNVVAMGCEVDGHSILLPTGNEATANGHKLVLPTNAMLDENKWEDKYAYFPLCESVTAEQSDILKWIQKTMKATVIEKSILIAETFFTLAASKDKKRSTYAKFLAKFKGVDANTLAEFKKLTSNASIKDWVRFYIDRNETVEGEQYLRVLYYTSAFFDSDTDDSVLMGVKMRSKVCKDAIVAVMKHILLDNELKIGSNGDAPSYLALMDFYVRFATNYNKLVGMVQKDIKLEPIDLSFAEHLDKVATYRGRIPALPGNAGKSTISKKTNEEDINFNPDKHREEQTRGSRRRHRDAEPESVTHDEEPTGLAIFAQHSSSHRGSRGGAPTSTGNPLSRRLYTDDRGSRRSRYDDDDDGGVIRSGRRRNRDRNGLSSMGRDRDDDRRLRRHGR